jgi:hypothetical protein
VITDYVSFVYSELRIVIIPILYLLLYVVCSKGDMEY